MSTALPVTETVSGMPALAARWRAYRSENPRVRIRDAARALAASEAELVATGCGETTIRLHARHWGEVIKELPTLGRVMALTRNDSCVHERHGVYGEGGKISVKGAMGLVLGPDIDLRLFLHRWRFGFAVTETSDRGARRSLQFFDAAGTAVHKVYATAETDMAAFDALVGRFTSDDQQPALTVEMPKARAAARPDSAIDVAGLREGWRNLQDTHDFGDLLKTFDVQRVQAMRLVGAEFAEPVPGSTVRRTLELAAARRTEIMIFVGNHGCIQIHSGTIANLKPVGPWFNILDPELNLHLREDKIATAWVVRKPTVDGVVTSVELYDSDGETIGYIFGKRKPGIPETADWRALVAELSEKP